MSALVTSNFDDDSIKNERASKVTAFSHYLRFLTCSLRSILIFYYTFMAVLDVFFEEYFDILPYFYDGF